jgi:single-stranded DNA-specific DHH superfamily exonuclease
MKLVLVVFLMMLSLMAEEVFPRFYAFMGDPLYLNAKGYRVLLQSAYFQDEYDAIERYLLLSDQSKQAGFKIDAKSNSSERINYMNDLRFLKMQDDLLASQLLARLQALFKEKHYDYLRTLQNNAAIKIAQAKVVTSSVALSREELHHEIAFTKMSEAQSVPELVKMQTRFNAYKKELLDAREAGNASECLNDMTALYHYFISIEMANDQKQCQKADEAHEQMKEYLYSMSLTCKERDTHETSKVKAMAHRYDTRRCEH